MTSTIRLTCIGHCISNYLRNTVLFGQLQDAGMATADHTPRGRGYAGALPLPIVVLP